MVRQIHIGDDRQFSGSRLPVLFYKKALDIPLLFPATYVKTIFEQNGWSNSWDAGIFTFHHYHSITHEVLGIYAGCATIQLGGAKGPALLLEKGDVLVIPAGVAHKNLDRENDICVVGAYPEGRDYDIKRGEAGERPQADRNIAPIPVVPSADPVTGPQGELRAKWGS